MTVSELYDPADPNAPLLEPADALNTPQRIILSGKIEFDENYTFAEGHGSSKRPAVQSLQVYPNPAADLLHIRLSFEDPTGQIVLEDQFGRPVLSRRLDGSSSTSFNVARIPAGVYTLRVTGEGLIAVAQKIIIQH